MKNYNLTNAQIAALKQIRLLEKQMIVSESIEELGDLFEKAEDIYAEAFPFEYMNWGSTWRLRRIYNDLVKRLKNQEPHKIFLNVTVNININEERW